MVQRDTPWPLGTPCWADLSTTDPDKARDFYGQLFGWHFNVGGPETGNYATADLNGLQVVGIGPLMGDLTMSVWTNYLASDDLDGTVDGAVRAGGTVIAPAMDVMEFGRMAVLADPTGAVFGVWQAGTHTGFQLANETGSVVWTEAMSRNIDVAKEFYAAVFGYTYEDMSGEGFRYEMFKVNGNVAGGLGQLPAEAPAEIPAHWRIYFAVDDADAAVEQINQLGGSLLQPPQDAPYGRWADVADAQGAAFSVIKVPPMES
jgi:predicted enzyme related to lactoylglutathione lyase